MNLEQAIEIIQDYPLYGSTSNSSAEELIAIAKVINKYQLMDTGE